MKKNAAVIGYPLSHSKSPLIHNYWMEKYDIAASYTAESIHPESFKQDVTKLLSRADIAGFNVTLPYKQDILSFCDHLDISAEKIGAVNTVYKNESGQIYGANTDAYGFWQNIVSAYPDYSIKGETACILGAGGAARAVAYALKEQGVKQLLIFNRTIEKAEIIANDFDGKAIDWEDKEKYLPDCALLVNTTSLGMGGQPPLKIDLSALNSKALVNDIVYAPLQTPLLQNAEYYGNKTVQGIGMLLYQAQKAFALWYGVMPEVDDVLIKKVLL